MGNLYLNYMKTIKKLFLTSFTAYVVKELIKFLDKDPQDTTTAFIPTAADPYKKNQWFVDEDKEALTKHGFNLSEVDIKNKTEKRLYGILSKFELIIVAGGNSFYLLEKSLESGFDKALRKLLSEGIVYVGGSAGAVIVGPSLEPVKTLDDPQQGKNLKNYNGMGIVDFVVLPHYGNPKYEARYKNIIRDKSLSNFKLIPLTNNQAIEVRGDKYKIISSSNE